MLFIILIFAFGLRLIALNQSLWLDEAIQAWAAASFSLKALLAQFMPTDVHPPLSYILTHFWGQIAGFSEIALRTPSLIFAILTIYFTYKIAQQILPSKKLSTFNLKLSPASLASLLLATSGLHIYYSQEARMYTLAALAVTISFWALLRLQKHKFSYLIYFISTLAAVYSHYFTWLILPVQLFIICRLQPRQLKKIILTQTAVILACLPWLPVLKHQLVGGIQAASSNQQWASVVGAASIKALILMPVKFLIGRISIDNNLIFALILSLPLILISRLFYQVWLKRKKHALAFTFLASWLIIPIILASLISFKLPILAYYRFLFTLPAFYLLITLAVNQSPKRYQNLIIISLILINLTTSAVYLFNPRFHRENWRQLTHTLVEKNLPQSPVIIISVVQAPLKYYYAGNNIYYYSQLDQLLDKDNHQLWLIPYAEPLFDPSLTVRRQLDSAGFKPGFKQHFRGNLTLIEYIK